MIGSAAFRRGTGVAALAFIATGSGCRCGRSSDGDGASGASSNEPGIVETSGSKDDSGANGAVFSAPIAAAHASGGEVLVSALDVPAKAIRLLRIGQKDDVVAQRTVFDDVKWTSDADLKVLIVGGGAAVTWRGLLHGRLGRSLVIVGADLVAKGPPTDVGGASCATREAIWFTDGKRAHGRSWTGASIGAELPKDKEASVVCGATRAFAFLEEDDGTSLLPLGSSDGGSGRASPVALLREADFGDDEQRERSEYTVGDEVGVVRLGASGALAYREVKDGSAGSLKKAHTKIPHDDDVVAVDASPKVLGIAFTQDASAGCPDGQASARVSALRIDRSTGEESTLELSSGMCAREVGPFFTGAVGDGVSVAWVERVPVAGKPKAPIVALAHAFVPSTGPAQTVKRIDVAADALVDAGCDADRCYAVALERKPGTDGMVPGPVKVLRYR